MIGSLRGRLTVKAIDEALLEVAGVGYRISIPLSTFEALPLEGDEAFVFTYLHVREDELSLYGFATDRERQLFETLIGISGIGPRLALHVLSRLSPDRFASAIRRGDLATLTSISGVGRKTAERMLVELRDKVVELSESDDTAPATALGTSGEDAVKALVALGIRRPAAEEAVRRSMSETPDAPAPELTRRALSSLSR